MSNRFREQQREFEIVSREIVGVTGKRYNDDFETRIRNFQHAFPVSRGATMQKITIENTIDEIFANALISFNFFFFFFLPLKNEVWHLNNYHSEWIKG